MPTYNTLYSIDFTTAANQSPLTDSGNLTQATHPIGYGPMEILSHEALSVDTSTGNAGVYYSGGQDFTANQWLSFKVANLTGTSGNNGSELGGYIRFVDSNGNCYYVQISYTGSAWQWNIVNINGGNYTGIGSGTVASISAGDVFRFSANGTTILLEQNGSTVFSGTDATSNFDGTAMWDCYPNLVRTDAAFANFAAGNIQAGHNISGNAGVAGATVAWTGTSSGSTTADGSGNYTIVSLADGAYTITPSKTGYAFSPTNSSQTVAGADITGVNFTASALHSISGNVQVSGVTVTLSGAGSGTTTSDGSGNYSFANLVDGSYTVTPTKAGYTFTPTSQNPTVSGGNVTGVNFTTGFSISGNAGVAGATITYSGTASGSVVADGSGNYTIPSLLNGNYLITPSLLHYTFVPLQRSEVLVGANIPGVNFQSSGYYSVPDCRVTKPNNAVGEMNQGTVLYDSQTSSNPSIPPTDSRGSEPVDSRGSKPTNSRTPGVFGPNEN